MREDYVKVKVPKDANVKTVDAKSGAGRMAEEGEIVSLSPQTIQNDPWLASHAVSSDDKPEDPYEGATVESMRKALKDRDLKSEGSKEELMALVKKHGVPPAKLEIIKAADQVNKKPAGK